MEKRLDPQKIRGQDINQYTPDYIQAQPIHRRKCAQMEKGSS